MSRQDSPLRDRVIFLVGARRSGTNWLQRIVAAHPHVACAPTETYLFSRGIALLAERFNHGAAGSYTLAKIYMDRDAFLDAIRDFTDRVLLGLIEVLDPDAPRIAERTPEHSQHLELIGDIYPDARIAHIIRDGRDVARSLVSQGWATDSIREAAAEWDTSVRLAQTAGARLDHYYEVRYEELLADPATEVPKLYRGLDLDDDPELVKGALVEAGVAFNIDPKMPTIAAGKWRQSFSAEDVAAFESVAGALLDELSYERAAASVGPLRAGASAAAATAETAPARESLLRRVRGRLAHARMLARTARDPLALGEIQLVVDQFLEAAAAKRADVLRDLIVSSANCRVVSAADDWRGRGEEARDRFITDLLADPALTGRQVRGDVYPAFPQYTFIGTYAVGAETLDRLLLLTVMQGGVTQVTWYQFPVPPAVRRD